MLLDDYITSARGVGFEPKEDIVISKILSQV